MEKGDLTYQVIGCAMEVHNKMHKGYMEHVYCRCLAIELGKKGIAFEREVWLPIHYDNLRIAWRRCDFLIAGKVVIEMKAKANSEGKDFSQALNMAEILNIRDALLLNFGADKLQFNHLFNNRVRPESDFMDATPDMVGENADDLFSGRDYLPDWLIDKMQRDRLKGKFKHLNG